MSETRFFKFRLYFTAIVTIAICSLLAWNYYHGGVPSHHLLAREDLPKISNWWGGPLLPLLTWFLLYRTQKRMTVCTNYKVHGSSFFLKTIFMFIGALLFGILLSFFFSVGYTEIPFYMLVGLFILALFIPIYQAECLLGFVIGMTFTFGAILPTGFGSILALIGIVIYLGVRPAILLTATKLVLLRSLRNKVSG